MDSVEIDDAEWYFSMSAHVVTCCLNNQSIDKDVIRTLCSDRTAIRFQIPALGGHVVTTGQLGHSYGNIRWLLLALMTSMKCYPKLGALDQRA